MKRAKVTVVRWRDPSPGVAADAPAPGDRVAAALRSYPRIGEEERKALLRFARRASRIEIRDRVLRAGLEPS